MSYDGVVWCYSGIFVYSGLEEKEKADVVKRISRS